jgi:hypothetical protein
MEDRGYEELLVPPGVPNPPLRPDPPGYSASRPRLGPVRSAYVAGRLRLLVIDVTPVTHAAGGAAKLGNNVVDPGFMVDSGVYVPPDRPHSPDQPR